MVLVLVLVRFPLNPNIFDNGNVQLKNEQRSIAV